MKFNKTIPELSVFDIDQSKYFYKNILGAEVEYERKDDKFVFLTIEGNQLMLEEIHHTGWNTGELRYPLGRGINISLEVKNIDILYKRIKDHHIDLFRDMMVNEYTDDKESFVQKEFLIQDPNGYLLRFTD